MVTTCTFRRLSQFILFNKKFQLTIFLIVLMNFFVIYNKEYIRSTFPCVPPPPTRVIKLYNNPPQLSSSEKSILKQSRGDNFSTYLSLIVQNQIARIQNPSNCSGYNILCGHFNDDCGFACQVHHRAACLMISYAKALPLIHDESAWSFSNKWGDMFHPLGSPCTPGPNTFHWTWRKKQPTFLEQENSICFFNRFKSEVILMDNTLSKGVVVDKELGDLVELNHPNPFLWWVGQFMKYSLRLNNETEHRLMDDKKKIRVDSRCIGIHARRTDKITEYNGSYHPIEDYISAAKDIVEKLQRQNQTRVFPVNSVFLASDDSKLLEISQNKFPVWNIIGFYAKETLEDQYARRHALYEIVRDVFTLADCQYVICGMSSNVCRLLLEMLSSKHTASEERLISLDSEYRYAYRLSKHVPITVHKISKNLEY